MDLEDMLEDMGISSPFQGKTDPTDLFYHELTSDSQTKHHKLYNCRYWLAGQISIINLMEKNGLYIRKNSADSTGARLAPASNKELTRSLLEVYFLTYHAPRFDASSGHTPCDMSRLLDKVLEHPEIIRTMNERGA